MKKLLLLAIIVFSFTQMAVAADHLKFMWIPLTGSISNFQTKLIAKGCRVNSKTSKVIPKGVRAYTGKFAGEKADIYVYYNEKTYTVYRAKAVITATSDNIRENKYYDFCSMLQQKYPYDKFYEGEQDDYPSFSIFVTDDSGSNPIGTIGVYQNKVDYIYALYLNEWSIHIDYVDYLNDNANDNSKMEDL